MINRYEEINSLQKFEFHDAIMRDVDFLQKHISLQFDGVCKFSKAITMFDYFENVQVILENAKIESMVHQGYFLTTSEGVRSEIKPKIVLSTKYQQVIKAIPKHQNWVQTVEVSPEKTEGFKIQFDIGGGGAEFGYRLVVVCEKFIVSWESIINK